MMKSETKDKGTYLLVLKLEKSKTIQIGKLGNLFFRKGFYIYVGSAMRGLSSRIKRHIGLKKKRHWHIDKFRQKTLFCYALSRYSSSKTECIIARTLSRITEWMIPRFGSSDCHCKSHLFGMSKNPVSSKDFRKIVKEFKLLLFEP